MAVLEFAPLFNARTSISRLMHKGTSMYYVSIKGGGRGSAKCLRLLTCKNNEGKLNILKIL